MGQIDREEFAHLFQQTYQKFWTLAAAIVGDRHQAQDIVQQAAITGLRRLDSYEKGTNFDAWMGQIVRFTALNVRKTVEKRKVRAVDGHMLNETVSMESAATADVVSPSGLLSQNQHEFDDGVTKALESLDPERRACLLLRVVNNLSYAEISDQLDLPEGTVMSHVHRAKVSLRKSLATSSAGGEQ